MVLVNSIPFPQISLLQIKEGGRNNIESMRRPNYFIPPIYPSQNWVFYFQSQ